MNIQKIWFLSSCIEKLCEVYDSVESGNPTEQEDALALLTKVIQSLQNEMGVNEGE